MKILFLAVVFLGLTMTARADVLLPLQYGGALLDVPTGTCSNSLDFSKSCNSQYVGIM